MRDVSRVWLAPLTAADPVPTCSSSARTTNAAPSAGRAPPARRTLWWWRCRRCSASGSRRPLARAPVRPPRPACVRRRRRPATRTMSHAHRDSCRRSVSAHCCRMEMWSWIVDIVWIVYTLLWFSPPGVLVSDRWQTVGDVERWRSDDLLGIQK